MSSINILDDDCLGALFQHFTPQEREVTSDGLHGYMEDVFPILEHLGVSAPALRRLTIIPPVHDIERYPPLLSLVGKISQVERLVLKYWVWRYSGRQTPSFRPLKALKRLKALELANIETCSFGEVFYDYGRDNGLSISQMSGMQYNTIQLASLDFQDSISTNTQLTYISLINVDFTENLALPSYGNHPLTPLLKHGSFFNKPWSNLRSLTFILDWCEFGDEGQRLPDLATMPELTHLHVTLNKDDPLLGQLASLHNLRELTLENPQGDTSQLTVAVSPAAKLTKLTVHDCQDLALGHLLPLATLRNVCNLCIGTYTSTAAPEWPTTWIQLTNLTRLSIDGDRILVARDEGRRKSFGRAGLVGT